VFTLQLPKWVQQGDETDEKQIWGGELIISANLLKYKVF